MTLKLLSTYPFSADGLLCYYHTGSAKNALDIVKNSHLRGSVPTQVNDPNDLRMTVEHLKTSAFLRKRFEICSGQQATPENLDNIEKCVACHAQDWMDKAYRFVCLAEATEVDKDCKSQRYFWQRYARKYAGVRFKFRIDSSFFIKPKAEETFFDRVTYGGKSSVLDFADVVKSEDIFEKIGDKQFLQDLMYDKDQKWSIEHEWRLGSTLTRLSQLPSKKGDGVDYFFNFNLDHLVGVDIGEAATPDTARLLIQCLQKRNILVRKASPMQYHCYGKCVSYQKV